MKITKIADIVVTPQDIVARVVEFEDGSGELQTFYRPHSKWSEGGLDAGSYVIYPSADPEYLAEIGFSDEEINAIFEGFDRPNFD